jgi:hypothetical protein
VGSTLGGLQGIEFSALIPVGRLHVGRHVAGSEPPFDGGVGEDHAELAGIQIHQFLASVALLHCRVAVASVEPASSLGHESALNTFFYRCTNHGYHILSLRFWTIESGFMPEALLIVKGKNNQFPVNVKKKSVEFSIPSQSWGLSLFAMV